MKKRLFLGLTILLISLLFSPHAFSQNTVVRITPSSVESPRVIGAELTVDVVIENGQNVAGYEFMLEFDSAALRYFGYKKGNYFSDNARYWEVKDENPLITNRIGGRAVPSTGKDGRLLAVSGSGRLATLRFEVIKVKTSSLTLVVGNSSSHKGTFLVSEDYALTFPRLESGRVTVSESAPAVFLREPNLSVGYEYTDVALLAPSTLRVIRAAEHHEVPGIAYISADIIASIVDNEKGDKNQIYFSYWNTNTSEWKRSNASLRVGSGRSKSLAYSPASKTLACGATDKAVYIWQRDGNRWRGPQKFSVDFVPESLTYGPNGESLAVGGGKEIQLLEWSQANGWQKKHLLRQNTPVLSLAYSPDGSVLASGSDKGTIHLWNPITGGSVGGKTTNGIGSIIGLAFSPDNALFAKADARTVYVEKWEQNTGVVSSKGTLRPSPPNWIIPHTGHKLTSLTFSPDGRALAAGTFGSIPHAAQSADEGARAAAKLYLWDLAPSRWDMDMEIPDGMISAVAHGGNATYFVLDAKFPKVNRFPNDEVYYGNCTITLHSPEDTQLFVLPQETPTQRAERAKDEALGTLGVKITVAAAGILLDSVAPGSSAGLDFIGGAIALGKLLQAYSEANVSVHITLQPRESEVWNPLTWFSKRGHPSNTLPFVVLLKNGSGGQITSLEFTMTQAYHKGSSSYKTVARGQWDLKSASAAPHAQPMSLADYPPFQSLPLEVQHYLLREFSEPGVAAAEALRVPEETSLLPNYPNPFNPETWIPYQLAESADVTLTIYDLQGRVVRDLDLGHRRAGVYQHRSRAAHWDGRNAQGEPVASGVYFYTLKAGDFSATRKMLIRK